MHCSVFLKFRDKALIYKPRFQSRSRFLKIRGLNYHVREWGDPALPTVLMVHGWMDVSASFQFVADQLADRFHILAPDWRGFGLTQWSHSDCYWFADYLADLDFLIDALLGDASVALVGHSMGGNVAMVYAGVRPGRVSHIINLEGFGLNASSADEAPGRLARWMEALKQPPGLRPYATVQEVAARLMKNNPRLSADKAAFLAPHWAELKTDGEVQRWEIRGDPAHRLMSPQLYQVQEVLACWRAITAPTLWVEALQTDSRQKLGGIADFEERLTHLKNLSTQQIDQAGHMLHHDQPEELARVMAAFLDKSVAA